MFFCPNCYYEMWVQSFSGYQGGQCADWISDPSGLNKLTHMFGLTPFRATPGLPTFLELKSLVNVLALWQYMIWHCRMPRNPNNYPSFAYYANEATLSSKILILGQNLSFWQHCHTRPFLIIVRAHGWCSVICLGCYLQDKCQNLSIIIISILLYFSWTCDW